jgi:LysM repeat protein
MYRRSPARFLAPLALAGFVLALLLVVNGSQGNGDSTDRPAAERTPAAGEGTSSATSTASRRKRRKTYTVKSGDTPSGIAERTGVPLERIQELNPDLDPQLLTPGDKLRLSE